MRVNPSAATTAAPAGVPSSPSLQAISAPIRCAAFFSIFGNTVAQGGANFPFQTWVANPFTPTANANLAAIQVAVGRLGSGTSGFEVGLYNDAGGIPGTLSTFPDRRSHPTDNAAYSTPPASPESQSQPVLSTGSWPPRLRQILTSTDGTSTPPI